jgi:hypothetical protein
MTRWGGGVFAVLVIAAAAAGRETPQDVLNRAIQAHGGPEAVKKFPAAKVEAAGKVFVQGVAVPFTTTSAVYLPGRSRLEMTFDVPGGGKTTIVQVVNGDIVKQTRDGNPVEVGDVVKDHAKQSAKWAEVTQLYPLLDADQFTLTLGKDTTFGGKKYAVVTVKAKGMPDATLYFERSTGRLTHTRRTTLNMAEEKVVEYTTRSEFKTIDGVTIAMKTVTTHNNRPYLEATVTKFTPLEKLDESLFDTK